MSNFKPIPIYKKEHELNIALNNWDARTNYFQTIVDKYIELNLNAPLLENDLAEMMENPKKFIFSKISTEEQITLSGVKINEEKLFDLIQKPDGCEDLIQFIENSKTKETPERWYYRHAVYFIIKDNIVEINPIEFQRITDQNTVFLNSQKDKDMYDLLITICENLNNLQKIKSIHHLDEKLFTHLLSINSSTGLCSINYDFYKV